jgi:WD40 repeat protein
MDQGNKEADAQSVSTVTRMSGERSSAGLGAGFAPEVADHELLRCIGQGSYGEVWLARNILGCYRAVKVVYRSRFEDERPFEREYAGIQKFEPVSRLHPSQVNILHVGRGRGYFYYVMELADNAGSDSADPGTSSTFTSAAQRGALLDPESYVPKTLRSELRRRGSLPVAECRRVALSLATALEHLHSHGLVHRDIKPSNIIFVGGVPKLADIGLVASVDDTFSCVGTAGYLAPEGPGTPAADVFGLGKVLYEICTGRDRMQFPELPTAIMELPDWDALAELNELVLKACALDPRHRYQSASELRAELELLEGGFSVRRKRAARRWTRLARSAGIGVLALGLLGATGVRLQRQASEQIEAAGAEKMRQRAQAQALAEQLEFRKAQEAFARSDAPAALAILAGILRKNPHNKLASKRLLFALSQRGFALPSVDPLEHDTWVWAAHFSKDSEKLLSISKDGTARLWKVNSGEPWGAIFQHGTNVTSGQISPDGRRVVTASEDHMARIWDVHTGRSIPLRHSDVVWFARFSSDGRKVVTASWDRTARIWDAETGEELARPLEHEAKVICAHFSSDGSKVVTASEDRTVRIWSAHSGLALGQPLRHESKLWYAEISPDGRTVATACEGGAARLWNVESGQPLSGPLAHGGPVLQLAFSPDGQKLVTASADHTARVYQVNTSQLILGPLRHDSVIRSARFSPDSERIVTASDDHTARLWCARTGRLIAEPLRHNGEVWHAEVSPDGTYLATASIDGRARIWKLMEPDLPSVSLENNSGAVSPQFSADGRWLLTMSKERDQVQVWDLELGRLFNELPGDDLLWASLSPDGSTVVAFNSAGAARAWHPASGQALTLPWTSPHPARSAWVSNGGERVILVSETAASPDNPVVETILQIGDAWAAGNAPQRFVAPGKFAALDPGDDTPWLATILADGTASIWNVNSAPTPAAKLEHSAPIEFARFSPNGRLIVTVASDHSAIVWDARTGRPRAPIIKHDRPLTLAQFSPDGTLLVTATEQRISLGRDLQVLATMRVWDAGTGRPLSAPMRHDGPVTSVQFSADGQKVLTASEDRTARVWHAPTGDPLSEPFSEETGLLAAHWQDTRQRLILVTSKTIRIINLPGAGEAAPDWLPGLAETLAGSNFRGR